jgi:hypothetical protein
MRCASGTGPEIFIQEHVIPETSTLQETTSLILAETQLLQAIPMSGRAP